MRASGGRADADPRTGAPAAAASPCAAGTITKHPEQKQKKGRRRAVEGPVTLSDGTQLWSKPRGEANGALPHTRTAPPLPEPEPPLQQPAVAVVFAFFSQCRRSILSCFLSVLPASGAHKKTVWDKADEERIQADINMYHGISGDFRRGATHPLHSKAPTTPPSSQRACLMGGALRALLSSSSLCTQALRPVSGALRLGRDGVLLLSGGGCTRLVRAAGESIRRSAERQLALTACRTAADSEGFFATSAGVAVYAGTRTRAASPSPKSTSQTSAKAIAITPPAAPSPTRTA